MTSSVPLRFPNLIQPLNFLDQDLPEDWPWNSTISEKMHKLYEYNGPGNLKDFVFILSPRHDQWVFVHKVIVDSGSPVLHRIIKDSESDDDEDIGIGKVVFYEMEGYKNLDLNQFKRMIEFIYTEKVAELEIPAKVSNEEIGSLLQMAKLFQLPRLEELCVSKFNKDHEQSQPASDSNSHSYELQLMDWELVDWNARSDQSLLHRNSIFDWSGITTPLEEDDLHKSKLTLTLKPRSRQSSECSTDESVPDLTPLEEDDLHKSKLTLALKPRSRQPSESSTDDSMPDLVETCPHIPLATTTTTISIPNASSSPVPLGIKREIMANVRSELKTQLIKTLKEELITEMQEDIADEIRYELDEMKYEMRKDIRYQLDYMKDGIAENIKDDLAADVCNQVRSKLDSSIREDLIATIKAEMDNGVQQHIVEKVKADLISEMTNGIQNELFVSKHEIWKEVMDTKSGGFIDNLKINVKSTLTSELLGVCKEMLSNLKNKVKEEMDNEILNNDQKGSFKDNFLTELKTTLHTDLLVDGEGGLLPFIKQEIKEDMDNEILYNGHDDGFRTNFLAELKTTLRDELIEILVPQLTETLKDEIETEILDDNSEGGFKDNLKSKLKTNLETSVSLDLEPQLEAKLKSTIELEVMNNDNFKDNLNTQIKTNLLIVVKEELVSELKDQLMSELRDELKDEVAEAIRNDIY